MYDGYGVHGARGVYLNGDDQTDDDHMRYSVTMETNGYYRIKTKATNRYVRLDHDKYVSSRFNIADDRSLFKLVEVQTGKCLTDNRLKFIIYISLKNVFLKCMTDEISGVRTHCIYSKRQYK
jgi:hypothetical protein